MKNLYFYLLVAVLGFGYGRVNQKKICGEDSRWRPSNWLKRNIDDDKQITDVKKLKGDHDDQKEINVDAELGIIYHYQKDPSKIKGDGWSCVYNNLQTLCSSLGKNNDDFVIPSLKILTNYFVNKINLKNQSWIEPAHCKMYLNEQYGNKLQLELIYYNTKYQKDFFTKTAFNLKETYNAIKDSTTFSNKIKKHLLDTKLPIIIDDGCSSYIIIGITTDNKGLVKSVKLADPHCFSRFNVVDYEQNRMIQNWEIDKFNKKTWMMLFTSIKD